MTDIWELQAQSHIPVIPTNTMRREDGTAIMGAGLALECAKRYPGIDKIYGKYLRMVSVPAIPMLVSDVEPPVLLFPTKFHFKDPSHIDLIATNLRWCNLSLSGTSLAIPRLGCGLGGLDWGVVRPVIEEYLTDVKYVFCEP